MTAIGERSRAARGGSRLDVKAVVVFFVLAYVLSWSWVIPLAAAHLVVRRGVGWPIHLPALLGPAIAAVVVTAWTMGRQGPHGRRASVADHGTAPGRTRCQQADRLRPQPSR